VRIWIGFARHARWLRHRTHRPKLATVLAEGYNLDCLRRDLLLVFMLTAAPLASFIPLSTLAGVLVVVCWNMAEKEDFVRLLYGWRSASVQLAIFGLTLLEDLTFGIIAGCVLAAAFALADRIMRSRRREP